MSQAKWTLEQEGFFTRLLRHAGNSQYHGVLCVTPDIGYTHEQLSILLGVDLSALPALLATMVQRDSIAVEKTGVIKIKNWQHYQTPYQDRHQYQKQYYENKRDTGDSTDSSTVDSTVEQTVVNNSKKKNKKKNKNKNNTQINTSLSASDRQGFALLMDKYNQSATRKEWIKCAIATDARIHQYKSRCHEGMVEHIDKVLKMMEANDWNSGRNDRGWKASIDYILQPGSWAKLLERSADFKEAPKSKGPRAEIPEL